jgi:polar amino acid transport system substrate-binding protein
MKNVSSNKATKLGGVAGYAILAVATLTLLISDAYGQSGLEKARSDGVDAAIAHDPPYTEFSPGGEMGGLFPEVMRAVLARLGITDIRPLVMEFGAMVPALQSGRFDLTAVGLYYTEPRCEAISFSEPIFCSTAAIVVRKGNPHNLLGLGDIASRENIIVSLQSGTPLEQALIKKGLPRERIVYVTDLQGMLLLVQQGRSDVTILPDAIMRHLFAQTNSPDLELVSPLSDARLRCAGVAFSKRDADFRDAFDAELQGLKSSGEFAEIMQRFNRTERLAIERHRADWCPEN